MEIKYYVYYHYKTKANSYAFCGIEEHKTKADAMSRRRDIQESIAYSEDPDAECRLIRGVEL